MADYAPNFTPRYKVRYQGGGHTHTQLWRPPPGAVLADMVTFALMLGGFYDTLADVLYDDTVVVDASFALENSDVFLPAAAPVIGGALLFSTRLQQEEALAVSFIGRSTAGQPWRIFMFGTAYYPGIGSGAQNYRVTAAEGAAVADATAFLNGASGDFVASDGVATVTYPYINVKPNDYWVGQLR